MSDDTAMAEIGDERLAHRGPIQQLLTRPEIGALLGVLTVWGLFWAVGGIFGTVAGTANYLDVAATLGIMSVAVALLMIGGEFDLSSGAMTGATGLLVIMISNSVGEFRGAGLNLWWAVLITFLLAMAIGWFNGTMVERTSLPSFIVTLGTFFILIGGKLGFAKRFTDKVIVSGLNENAYCVDGPNGRDCESGYGFWEPIFNAVWLRNDHLWEGRDLWWAGFLIAAGVLLSVGTVLLAFGWRRPVAIDGTNELRLGAVAATVGAVGVRVRNVFSDFIRERTDDGPWGAVKSVLDLGLNTLLVALLVGGVGVMLFGDLKLTRSLREAAAGRGLPLMAGAIAVAIVGFVGLLRTNGTSANVVFAALVALGTVGAFVGLGDTFFIRREGVEAARWTGMPRVVGGVLAIVAGIVIGAWLNSSDERDLRDAALFDWINDEWMRRIFFGGLILLGLLTMLSATKTISGKVLALSVGILAVPTLLFLTTVQAARAVLFCGLVAAGIALLIIESGRADRCDRRMGLIVGVGATVAMAAVAFFIRYEGTGRRIRVEAFSTLMLVALFVLIGVVMRFLYQKASGADASVAGVGQLAVSGGVLTFALALGARMLYMTAAEAEVASGVTRFRISILWFLIVAAIATFVLGRTRFGSWIFAVGGNKDAARSVGVPAARTKTTLFMIVSGAAWLVGMLLAFRLGSIQADVGDGQEFRYIIAAVVGGNLLTGGYGSASGAAMGAVIWAMITQGIGFSGWNSNWRFLVLGLLLLVAVIVNNYVRQQAEKAR